MRRRRRPRRRPPAREPVQVETQGELWEAMQLECNELLEAIEREALALEDSAQPKTSLQALMRHFHTLKGVVNTIGLHPTGKLVHAVEDFLEKLLEAPILPPMRKVASLVLDVRDGVRRNIGQAHQGAVEVLLPRFEPRIARLLAGRARRRLGRRPPPCLSGLEEGASVRQPRGRPQPAQRAQPATRPRRRAARAATATSRSTASSSASPPSGSTT